MGQTSGLFLNETLYWVFTSRHKKCIKSGYIFECELIYCIFSGRMVTYTVHRVRAGSTTWHDERKHRPPNGICYLNGTLYCQRYVDSPGSCGSNGSCYSSRLMPVVSASHVQLSHMGGLFEVSSYDVQVSTNVWQCSASFLLIGQMCLDIILLLLLNERFWTKIITETTMNTNNKIFLACKAGKTPFSKKVQCKKCDSAVPSAALFLKSTLVLKPCKNPVSQHVVERWIMCRFVLSCFLNKMAAFYTYNWL